MKSREFPAALSRIRIPEKGLRGKKSLEVNFQILN